MVLMTKICFIIKAVKTNIDTSLIESIEVNENLLQLYLLIFVLKVKYLVLSWRFYCKLSSNLGRIIDFSVICNVNVP